MDIIKTRQYPGYAIACDHNILWARSLHGEHCCIGAYLKYISSYIKVGNDKSICNDILFIRVEFEDNLIHSFIFYFFLFVLLEVLYDVQKLFF